MTRTKVLSRRATWAGLLALLATVPLSYAQRTQPRSSEPARGEAPRAPAPPRAPAVDRVNHGSFGHVDNPVARPPAPHPNNPPFQNHGPNVYVQRDPHVDFHPHQFWHDFHFKLRFHDLPVGYVRLVVGGAPYFYDDGIYYQQVDDGYQEVYPPVGAVVTQLPDGAIAIEAGNLTYYYAGGAFYVAQDGGYVIAPTPIGVTVPELPPDAVQVSLNGGVAYQFNGIYYEPVFVDGVTQYVTVAPPN